MGYLLRLSALTAAAALAFTATAHAAPTVVMYGANGYCSGSTRGDILIVDQTDANIASTLGNAVSGSGITGIDFDNSDVLWGSTISGQGTTSTLISIDPTTGSATGTAGPIHTNSGDVLGSALSIGDLAYDSTTSTMFGITSNAAFNGAGGDIYTIDLGTGLASFIGSTIWGTSAGLAFDGAGTLYALGYDPAVGPFGTNMLFTLSTSDATELSRLTVSNNDLIFDGLGINSVTGAIYATQGSTGDVYTVDGTTGAMALIGNPSNGKMSDLAFRVPEPGTLAVMGLGLVGLVIMRRRRVA